MYADDSSFFLSGPSPDALILSANTELTKVYRWLIQNKGSLNIKKSKYMFFYKSQLKCEVTSQLQINNHTIERVRQFTFLGYQLDEKLSWNSHISRISSKVAKNIGLLLKFRKVLHYVIYVFLSFTRIFRMVYMFGEILTLSSTSHKTTEKNN